MERKTKIGLILIIFVSIVMLIAILFVSGFFEKDKKTSINEPEIITIDDRVSPYTNQGLVVEVLRIRNRGLTDIIMNVGLKWRKTPSFYWIITVDGKESNSKGKVGQDGVYNQWDTIGEEGNVVFDIEEEQKKSEVLIKIIEEEQVGLLKRKKNDVEKEIISLVYDFRTGRWNGDDYYNDDDGFGHFLGEKYEIWFNVYQIDYDNDNIPYWIEKNVLGTDPTIDDRKQDPDNDGIPTSWEYRWGYNPFIADDHEFLDPDIDGIENIEEYQMRNYFANPYQPDIYIETDGMEKKRIDFRHIFFKESQQMIVELFARHRINVYIDDGWPDGPINGGGEMLPYYEYIDDVIGRQAQGFYEHNFADERKGIFRYVIIGHKHAGIIFPCNNNVMDTMLIGTGIKPVLKIKRGFSPRLMRVARAKSVLHELGHSLGLMPYSFPGVDIMDPIGKRYPSMDAEEYEGYMKQYYSIMNYYYIFRDSKLFDYSDGSNGAPYDQNDWAHLYLPSFQTNMISYEESVDETFEDFEVINDYPGILLKDWDYSENLTDDYAESFQSLSYVKNTNSSIQIYIENEPINENQRKIRIYAIPFVKPQFAPWSLVAEGHIDSEDNIELYDQQILVEEAVQTLSAN